MPIVINHNLCDEAPECGGIEVCPAGAFYLDKKKKKIAIDKTKCTECLKCTLPDACPVGCIIYARNEKEVIKIEKMIKDDPRKSKWLWKARYGCEPAKTPPKEKIITDKNINNELKRKGFKLIDVWHYDHLDCRYFSPLFSDILKGVKKKKIIIYKLDAQKYPKLAAKLKVKKFPSLNIFKNTNEVFRYKGLLKKKDVKGLNKKIKRIISEN
jgi:ferredoxin